MNERVLFFGASVFNFLAWNFGADAAAIMTVYGARLALVVFAILILGVPLFVKCPSGKLSSL